MTTIFKTTARPVFVSRSGNYTAYENGITTLNFFDLCAWGDEDTGWWVDDGVRLVGAIEPNFKVMAHAHHETPESVAALEAMARILEFYTMRKWD